MTRSRLLSTVGVIVVAIGCGSGKPQSASAQARSPEHAEVGAPTQLALLSESPQPASGHSAATIQGVVRLSGTAPQRALVKMSADPVCQQQHAEPFYSEETVVDEQGGLKNVFVYVKQGLTGAFPAPAEPVALDQSGCWYRPHVFGVQADQPLGIINSDATLHNVNAKPTLNQPFNIAQPVKGMKTTKKFAKPEVMVKFKCNVHPWMSAYAGVVDHPFFGVTDEHGAVTISGLPAGTYVLEAWHEKYGTQTQTVTVADGETKPIEWTFSTQ
ncbi:MAG: carboxypeptidase regulatory-like domain-containing protein [Candidatus Omnitrophica bacterium]|nr:carboxypeptidase regulatory-like domain-containing protein [Candidatus Omnitrophota bacterium]